MKNNVVIATHHKTGTVWMATVFKAIAEDLGATYVDYWAERENLAEALKPPFVLFNYDSDFRGHSDLLDRDDVRILHLIRDPRDVLISAMHYHCKSGETWLHEPVPGYDNITYQRRLNAFAARHEQYVFEMENSTFSTLRDMQQWRYGRTNCFEARYEKMRLDTEMKYWSGIMDFLGFDAAEQQVCRRRFWQYSLFGNLGRGHKHVRSGDVAQWKREFTPTLAAAFRWKFPRLLQSLGYEPDDRWVGRVKGPRPSPNSNSAPGTRGPVSLLKRIAGRPWERFKAVANQSA